MNIERWVKTNRLTDEQLAIANELNERGIETFTDAVFSIGEPALAIISSSIAEPIAGLAGLGMAAFEDVNSGVKTIEQVKNALSYQPRTRGGKTGMEFVADTLQPVSDAFTAAEDYLGDNTLELTGSPLLAAGAATIPAAIAELNPLGKASKQATKMDIFAGKKAKTADLNKQAMAEELLNRGMDRDTIWKETGWFKDVDDHWKFEIDDSWNYYEEPTRRVDKQAVELSEWANSLDSMPDSDVLMNMELDDFSGTIGEYKAAQRKRADDFTRDVPSGKFSYSDTVTHDDLFKAYPWSRDVGVKFGKESQYNKANTGSYEPRRNKISVTADSPQNESILLHEMQHAIQENEGFAKGGSAQGFADEYNKNLHNLNYFHDEKTNAILKARKTPEYLDNEAKINKALDDGDKNKLPDLLANRRRMEADATSDISREIIALEEANRLNPFEKYQRLAGEAEARNVQTRMNFTPEERAATPPWKTLDVPGDELILKDVSGLAMSDGGFSFEPPAFSEKMAARRAARKDIFRLPTKGDATNINHVTDLFDYSPSQLVNQIKVLDQNGIRNGGYLKQGDAVHTFFKDDGTSQLIDAKTNKVLIENDIDQTERLLKDEIINKAQNKKTPEQVEAEYEAKRAERLKAREAEALQKDSYKMQHTAPTRTDNSLGFDLTTSFGEDIYSPKALQYFGTGADYDSKALTVINRIRNNPDRMVTVYRAVPKEVNEINPKDWVTTTKEYALDHMKGEEGWHILKKDVRAGDIATDGNSIHEWGYDPE